MSMYSSYIYLMISIKTLYYIYSDVILLVSSSKVWAYELTPCDMSCGCSHMPFHYQNKKKRKFKTKEILN